jgi:hypothetical protein
MDGYRTALIAGQAKSRATLTEDEPAQPSGAARLEKLFPRLMNFFEYFWRCLQNDHRDGRPGHHRIRGRGASSCLTGVAFMRGIRVVIGSFWLLGTSFGLAFVAGCSDDSRKTGTQVQVSEQQKAQDDMMKDAMSKDRKK